MQLTGLLRNDRRVGLVAALALSAGLIAGSLGCGGSSNDDTIVLPPGGVAIGELICSIASSVPGDVVVQGEVITVTFRITDVNQRLVGQFLPVSWEIQGGFLPDAPTETDENGEVTVQFVTDVDYIGNAFVRMIQPESDLRCDFTFRLVQAACTLTAEIQDELGATLAAGCGASVEMTRDVSRTIVWTVTRPNPETGVTEPVVGASLLVRTSGQATVPAEFEIGPTDVDGRVELEVSESGGVMLHPSQVGTLTVTAEVIIPLITMDGETFPTALACNVCAVQFNVSDPVCDNDGATVMVSYPYMDVLRPGEFATLSFTLTRDGVPIAGEELLVSSENGTINGSALPVLILTDGAGLASVVYQPFTGFGGTLADPEVDVVTFEAQSASLDCTLTGEVNVATCGLSLDFVPAPEQGEVSAVTLTVTNVDTATTDGRTVSLDQSGGTLTPPNEVIGELAAATYMIEYHSGVGQLEGSISLSFIDGYPCDTVTEFFAIAP